MSKFGSDAVEDLEYDFSKWGGTKGTIPEPSQKAMKKYQGILSRIQIDISKAMRALQDAREEDVDEDMVAGLEKAVEDADTRLSEALAKLCQDSPSFDDLAVLPFRVKQGFVGWIMKELSPEGGASGTSN